MGAGRPVRLREKGFKRDVTGLGHLRTALKLQQDKLDREEVQDAINNLDKLVENLIRLTNKMENAA